MGSGIALANSPDVSGLCMLACYPQEQEAEALARDGGSDPAKMHVTLVFLGEVAELDIAAVRRAAKLVATKVAPLSGTVGGVGMFAANEEGYPVLALPDVQGLSTLRTRVEDALATEGIKSPSEHGWTPHLTLAYVDEPELADTAVIGKPLSFNALTVTVADKRSDFALTGRAEEAAQMSRFEQRRIEFLVRKGRTTL